MSRQNIFETFQLRENSQQITRARWYLIAAQAVALASANTGQHVVELYKKVVQDVTLDDQKIIQRRMKEAILKTSAFYGIPRSLQALLPLFKSLKDEEIDHYGPRWELSQTDEVQRIQMDKIRYEKARRYFDTIWTPESAQANRDNNFKYHPDLYLLNTQLAYEYYISEDAILTPIETQMCNIAALICCECPVQAMWHTRGLINHGGSMEEAQFAQDLGLAIAELSGCKHIDSYVVENGVHG
ncbi:hypothetical protein PFICI_15404 [Pestalotiopsis fici W106-1]|uniref:Carboxymuconolactone decarboxylase-like domain-containing protein n=1 Tax=Pestalotiopsis fici (strain W106-1 / CGMCC3.15140) TaxID=1229662 RepID=W3WJA1_PESFW|nr:uncharacterized protein PFICI_15404 [Pestalotiopsis fici W106-1]ETS72881.1 hypothetical protein PFICI_15404 [Pestalotiopsis fici W106-1]